MEEVGLRKYQFPMSRFFRRRPFAPTPGAKESLNASSAENQAPLRPSSKRPLRKLRPLPMFAVIVGVDEYKDSYIPRLSGAVADADAVRDFLVSTFGVATNHMVNLRNSEATKTRITQALESLATNSDINVNDPILIYFAGHGSTTRAPSYAWKTSNEDNTIQMILPYDFSRKGSPSSDGQGIWDIRLSTLLENVAKAKSDNITVILDCCHSGSGTRNDSNTRGIELLDYSIPTNVFEAEIGSHRATTIHKDYKNAGLMSHVLLAACKAGQTSKEVPYGEKRRGAFTLKLLPTLAQGIVDQVTYQEIIESLPKVAEDQHPQCEGVNQYRVLFSAHGKKSGHIKKAYSIHGSTTSEPEIYLLEAGSAHGVTAGATFSVYSDSQTKAEYYLGSVKATQVRNFDTTCTFHGSRAPFVLYKGVPAFAIQTQIGTNEHIFISIKDQTLRSRIESIRSHNDRFRLIDHTQSRPDLLLTSTGSRIQFDIMDQICRKNEMKHMPFDFEVDVDKPEDLSQLLSIIRKASDFYWHLRRFNTGNSISDKSKISLECFKLVKADNVIEDKDRFYRPLVPTTPNFNVNGTITIIVDDSDIYGFKVNNLTKRPLYVALFYFDVSDLSIRAYYLPASAADGKADFSLPPQKSLPIGYGDSGTPGQTFSLRDDQTVDVGFLKLYFCTEYVDFSSIAQESPFSSSRGSANAPKGMDEQIWDAITIPVIQRAAKGSNFNRGLGGILNRCFRFLERS